MSASSARVTKSCQILRGVVIYCTKAKSLILCSYIKVTLSQADIVISLSVGRNDDALLSVSLVQDLEREHE